MAALDAHRRTCNYHERYGALRISLHLGVLHHVTASCLQKLRGNEDISQQALCSGLVGIPPAVWFISGAEGETIRPERTENCHLSFVACSLSVGRFDQQLPASPDDDLGGRILAEKSEATTESAADPNVERGTRSSRGLDPRAGRGSYGQGFEAGRTHGKGCGVRLVALFVFVDLLDIMPHIFNAGRAFGGLRWPGNLGSQAEKSKATMVSVAGNLSRDNREDESQESPADLGTPIPSPDDLDQGSRDHRIRRLAGSKTGKQLFHRLRRTTITFCAIVDQSVAQRTAGHRDFATTQKYYIDPRIYRSLSAADILPDPLENNHTPSPASYGLKTPVLRIYR